MTRRDTGITNLLAQHAAGDAEALKRLFPLVYDRLRRIAQAHFNRMRPGNTLVPTALVHETFLTLTKSKEMEVHDREHFFAVAAQCMRWILSDQAKKKKAAKRGGEAVQICFDEAVHSEAVLQDGPGLDLVALSDALDKLERQSPRLAKVVELRYLTGLGIEETAKVMHTSAGTVKRDWTLAKAWLQREIQREEKED